MRRPHVAPDARVTLRRRGVSRGARAPLALVRNVRSRVAAPHFSHEREQAARRQCAASVRGEPAARQPPTAGVGAVAAGGCGRCFVYDASSSPAESAASTTSAMNRPIVLSGGVSAAMIVGTRNPAYATA